MSFSYPHALSWWRSQTLFRPGFSGHFNMIWAPEPSYRSMDIIFTSILKGFLSASKGLLKIRSFHRASPLSKCMVKSEPNCFPTSTKSHYTFNFMTWAKFSKEFLEINYDNLPNKETLVSLWVHEAELIFYDRLVDEKDRAWFFQMLESYLQNNFQIDWDSRAKRNFIWRLLHSRKVL